jgi:hypothetical protein
VWDIKGKSNMLKRFMNLLTIVFSCLTAIAFATSNNAKDDNVGFLYIFLIILVGGFNYVFFGKVTLWNKNNQVEKY